MSVFAGKHILIIVENLPLPFDRRVWQEASTLTRAGAKVSVICPRTKNYASSYEEIDGIRIYRHPLPVEANGAVGYLIEYSTALFWELLLSVRIFARERRRETSNCPSEPSRSGRFRRTERDAYHRRVMDDAWATRSATEQAQAIRATEITSRELLELYLDRIERLDPAINAVVTLAAERARAEADAADARTARRRRAAAAARAADHDQGRHRDRRHPLDRRRGRADRPRAGRRRAGRRPAAATPARSCSARPTCRAGRATLQSYNELFGTTNNPWDVTRVPGGSSGGPAAAVAAGFTSFELGTDIGGSVRIPSHCCGMFGLKPSYGVVPQRGYLDSVGGGTTDADINVFGPMARSADDLDLLLSVLAGPEPARQAARGARAAAAPRSRRSPGAASACGSTTRRCRPTRRCSTCCAPPSTPSPTPAPRSRRSARRSTRSSRSTLFLHLIAAAMSRQRHGDPASRRPARTTTGCSADRAAGRAAGDVGRVVRRATTRCSRR